MLSAPTGAARRGRERLAWVVAAALGVALVAAVLTLGPGDGLDEEAVARTMIVLSSEEQLVLGAISYPLAVSPDGSQVVYAAERAGRVQLFLRSLDQLDATVIPGTDGARHPFFSSMSPDRMAVLERRTPGRIPDVL